VEQNVSKKMEETKIINHVNREIESHVKKRKKRKHKRRARTNTRTWEMSRVQCQTLTQNLIKKTNDKKNKKHIKYITSKINGEEKMTNKSNI